jgi:hypothetical protein
MATTMNDNTQSTVGLLLIFGEIISNQQRDEIFIYLKKAFKYIEKNKFDQIQNLFNNLIHHDEFQSGLLFFIFYKSIFNFLFNRFTISSNSKGRERFNGWISLFTDYSNSSKCS